MAIVTQAGSAGSVTPALGSIKPVSYTHLTSKMLDHNVLVRKAEGIETAGSLNILFSDKTGTITCLLYTSHIPKCEKRGDYTYINPGSVSIPKEGSAHSYVILEDQFYWKDLDGNVYMTER